MTNTTGRPRGRPRLTRALRVKQSVETLYQDVVERRNRAADALRAAYAAKRPQDELQALSDRVEALVTLQLKLSSEYIAGSSEVTSSNGN